MFRSHVSSKTKKQNRIEQLNRRFQLSIPMNTNTRYSLKKASFPPDDSTCSSTGSDSSNVSMENTCGQVRFCEEVIEFLPSRRFLTREETCTVWFSKHELADIKASLRLIYNRPENNNEVFRTAVDRVQQLFARQNLYVMVDADDPEKTALDSIDHQRLIYKEAAYILGRDEARGLERMQYGKPAVGKFWAKSLHIQRYVAAVLETQNRLKHCPLETRTSGIAAQCHSVPSTLWALAVADADEEAVVDKFQLKT
jgi:hypothetical protein